MGTVSSLSDVLTLSSLYIGYTHCHNWPTSECHATQHTLCKSCATFLMAKTFLFYCRRAFMLK